MANPFEVQVVNPLQALLTGAQAYKTTNDASVASNKNAIIQSAAQDYQNGNQQGALAKLLGVGAYQEASAINNITGSAADRARQAKLDERQTGRDAVDDKFRAESLALQKAAAARAAEDKFIVKEVTDANGNTTLVRVKTTGGEGPINTGVAPTTAANPFAYGKQNENQSKDSGYANRLFDAETVLRQPNVVAAGTSITQKGLESVPIAGNYMTSPDRQKYDQAARNFINGVLRRESGAAISQSEFDNAYKQYLPQPGDSPERLAEKQKNRQTTLASIAGGGGQSYRPPYTFGPNGEMVPTGSGKQGAAPATKQSQGITQEQYATLPSGSVFTAPDGTQRVKP